MATYRGVGRWSLLRPRRHECRSVGSRAAGRDTFPCAPPQRPSGSRRRWSAVGPPEDGLRQDRPPELLLAEPFPRRPVAGLVVVKARALQPSPSPYKPPSRLGVPVGVTPSHLATPSTAPAQRAAVPSLHRVGRRSNGVVAFRRPAARRGVPRPGVAAT